MARCSKCKRESSKLAVVKMFKLCDSCIAEAAKNPLIRPFLGKAVKDELSKGSTDEQIRHLADLAESSITMSDRIKQTLMDNAPKEMDKAIRKLKRESKPITVSSLTEESRSNATFVSMCDKVGIDMKFFDRVARERMIAAGILVTEDNI